MADQRNIWVFLDLRAGGDIKFIGVGPVCGKNDYKIEGHSYVFYRFGKLKIRSRGSQPIVLKQIFREITSRP